MARKRSVIKNILPKEITMEILYRLPPKFIGRFRCVSKEWSSLLTEPGFIKTHHKTFNRNHHIIIFKSLDVFRPFYFLSFHQNNIEDARLSRPKKYALPFDSDYGNLDVIGCCNGLVLLSAVSNCGLKVLRHCLIVLNPTTKDFLELPVCDCCYYQDNHLINRSEKRFLYGFIYDSFTDDYKVVTIFYKKQNWYFYYEPTVHVYSLRTNTWKHVIYFPYHLVSMLMTSSNAFINGNIHRLATKNDDPAYEPKIVAFSLGDETISEVPLPNDYMIMRPSHCELVDVGGKLGIFRESDGVVWLMNEYGVKESWTKIKVYHGLHKNPRGTLFHNQEGNNNIMIVCQDVLFIYNLEGKGCRCEYCKATSTLWKDLTAKAICVQSLVSPNNYGRVNNVTS